MISILFSPQWMLLFGIFLSFLFVNQATIQKQAKIWSSHLLQISVIFLGASLSFHQVIKQGSEGVLITFLSISFIFILGFIGSKILKLEKILSTLITMGTAICGGSAIGALAPVLKADSISLTVSIGIVFLLNALALFIFPPIGHSLGLTQDQFGLWSALAIHDTSSVVAASASYGTRALEVGTTIKLTRALWIIPVTLVFSFFGAQDKTRKIKIPWFVFGFLGFSLAFTFIDQLNIYKDLFLKISKLGFSITLFLIGISFNIQNIKQVGPRPFVFGLGLWIIVVVTSLLFVMS